ncbi:MAG: hypothetical protein NUV47_03035 [Patescibacteria group bacterium]|nr:hypothetical protein [Patescibacteria group bacterium]
MHRKQSLLILGIWVIILPFLGFPSSWKTFLFFITGVTLIIIYIRNKPEEISKRSESYVDNRNSVVSPLQD